MLNGGNTKRMYSGICSQTSIMLLLDTEAFDILVKEKMK
jgi:hypothetical protein